LHHFFFYFLSSLLFLLLFQMTASQKHSGRTSVRPGEKKHAF